jgi:membrane protein DedA with SNARE-associated domain
LESLIAHLGYVAVLIGVIVEGETVLVAAGALAHRGDLSLPIVIVAAFVGSTLGDQGWFHFGARFGPKFLERHPRVRRRADAVRGWFSRYGTTFVLGFRFLYGFRTATPIMLGATHYPKWRFGVLNAVGALLWSITIACVGWGIGATFALTLRRAGHTAELFAAALAVALVLARIVRPRRQPS